MDTYSRYVLVQNENFWKSTKPQPTQSGTHHGSVKLSPSTWFKRLCNGYYNFVKSQNQESAECLADAIESIQARALPQINLNHNADATIFDSFDIFVKYYCAMNQFIFQFITMPHQRRKNDEEAKNEQPEHLPLQLDFWIIPRLIKTNVHNDYMVGDDINDFKYDQFDDDDDADDGGDVYPMENGGGNIQNFGKNNQRSGDIWDLETNLKESGYVEGEDYWTYIAAIDDNDGHINVTNNYNMQQIIKNLRSLWQQNENWKSMRYKRYILIIDRRNPQQIAAKKMIDDTHKDQSWNDKMYLIMPKKANEIAKLYDNVLNEIFLANTKDFLFPIPRLKMMDMRNDMGGLSGGNGYKFIVSYHLYTKHKAKMYWYFGQGVTRFCMKDIHWLWPRYFKMSSHGSFQSMGTDTKLAMDDAEKKYKLKDSQFDDFRKQFHKFDAQN